MPPRTMDAGVKRARAEGKEFLQKVAGFSRAPKTTQSCLAAVARRVLPIWSVERLDRPIGGLRKRKGRPSGSPFCLRTVEDRSRRSRASAASAAESRRPAKSMIGSMRDSRMTAIRAQALIRLSTSEIDDRSATGAVAATYPSGRMSQTPCGAGGVPTASFRSLG
jgi:hypothetical protein